MNFDFALLLTIAALVTGLIWALDALVFAPRRREAAALAGDGAEGGESRGAGADAREPVIVEYARSFFPVILIVLLLRSFLVEPFRIPSGSMLPTLLVGDFILVNKFTYGIRLPVVNYTVLELGEPQRGDVIVFRYPEDPSLDYIKRVVGVPGDEVSYRDKVLYINGERAEQQPVGYYEGGRFPMLELRLEQLGDATHQIIHSPASSALDFTVTVPEDSYFVMGDNRDNSRDSRAWGFVPEENLVGKAFMIWMNWGAGNGIGWRRIGTLIE